MVRRGVPAFGLLIGVLTFAAPSRASTTTSPAAVSGSTVEHTDDLVHAFAHLDEQIERRRKHRPFGAWTATDDAVARVQLAAASSREPGPMRFRTVAVKDNIDVVGLPTTAGASVLATRRPTRNATVVERLLDHGAVVLGHTNMDTWARGVRSVSQTAGSTGNAWDASLGPMGSSGGSAVAVAHDDADIGIGTDTCGSLRYPAAANLVFALRPTPGVVSRAGVIPLSPTQDVVGPIARSPLDLAITLDAIAGADPRDPLTLGIPKPTTRYVDAVAGTTPTAGRWRVGIVTTLGRFRADASGHTMLDRLRDAGIELVPVGLPGLPDANVIDHESLPSRALVLGGADESLWLAEPLRVTDPHRYAIRIRARLRVAESLVDVLDDNHLVAIVYPTTPYLPARRGAAQPSANCHLSSTSGLPALTVPHGLDGTGVPVPGIDLLGRPFDETTLLALAAALTADR
jgi:amidase